MIDKEVIRNLVLEITIKIKIMTIMIRKKNIIINMIQMTKIFKENRPLKKMKIIKMKVKIFKMIKIMKCFLLIKVDNKIVRIQNLSNHQLKQGKNLLIQKN